MEWMDSMAQYGQDKAPADNDMVDDEDFYGNGLNTASATKTLVNNALPGAARDATAMVRVPQETLKDLLTQKAQNVNGNGSNSTATFSPGLPALTLTLSAEQRKLENQKKAEQLRAKLIANRQNTPNRANTPNKMAIKPNALQEMGSKGKADEVGTINADNVEQKSEPSSDIFGIEALLQEGRAAAEAKAQAEDSAKINAAARPNQPAEPVAAPVQQKQQAKKEVPNSNPPESAANAPDHATEYYSDLAIWLEMTGYHDIDYRNSKLRTYRERKALEEEAARIQERLEKLRQDEQAEMQAMRSGSVHPAATPSRLPPTLPNAMSAPAVRGTLSAAKEPIANGTKRAHSPEPMLADKNPRHREEANNGIRIRGANDSPQDRNGRGRAGSPLDRRVSYSDARRRESFGGRQSRDPSLERRQGYYRRDGESARVRERYEPYPTPRENAGRGRVGFSTVNVPQEGAYREPYSAPPRGIRDVDTGRGADVRYFMIKSWNADNVATAMRDSLWSTQEKNEQLLADAYRASSAVVLCFSVNNSKAFQGYALMTSPPSPSLPKPAFCSKLNWPTSPAFTLNWLATTSVHFRHVGHIKNEMNLDEDGRPCAVLVGKDGQEIAPEAGRALCEILDEVDAGEAGGRGAGSGGGRKGRGSW